MRISDWSSDVCSSDLNLVGDALAKGRLSPNRLELEVTESIFLTDGDGALKILKQLQMQGIRIALDDFGTGYSSLGYLNKAIFNKLKIDRSFVREAGIKKEADRKSTRLNSSH